MRVMKKNNQTGAPRERLRQCVGCRSLKNKADMIRVIRTPEGEIEIDLTGRKNGRGAYLCRDNPECLKKAVKKKILEKSLGVAIPMEVADKLTAWAEKGTDETI